MFLHLHFLGGHFDQNDMVKLKQNQVITFTRMGWSIFPDFPLYFKNKRLFNFSYISFYSGKEKYIWKEN